MNPLVQGLSDNALAGAIRQLEKQPWNWPSRLEELKAEYRRRNP